MRFSSIKNIYAQLSAKLAGTALVLALTTPLYAVEAQDYRLEELVDGFDMPWGLAFLPDGDMLVTELTGDLRVIRNGKLVVEPVANVPASTYGGQGGLMVIALHPQFERNRLVYLSMSVGTAEASALRVVRGRFTGDALENISTVFEAAPKKRGLVHYGARMSFLPDMSLLITVGDGFDLREHIS